MWGLAGSVLALETLQRALQLGNRARSLLVGAALGAGLVPVLLAKLDWRSRAQPASIEEQVTAFSAAALGPMYISLVHIAVSRSRGRCNAIYRAIFEGR